MLPIRSGPRNNVQSLFEKDSMQTTWGFQPSFSIRDPDDPAIDARRRHRKFIPTTTSASPPRLTLLPAPSIEAGHCVLDRPRNYARCGCPYPHTLLPHAPMPLPLAGRVCQSYGGLKDSHSPGRPWRHIREQCQSILVRSGVCDLDSLLRPTSPAPLSVGVQTC